MSPVLICNVVLSILVYGAYVLSVSVRECVCTYVHVCVHEYVHMCECQCVCMCMSAFARLFNRYCLIHKHLYLALPPILACQSI